MRPPPQNYRTSDCPDIPRDSVELMSLTNFFLFADSIKFLKSPNRMIEVAPSTTSINLSWRFNFTGAVPNIVSRASIGIVKIRKQHIYSDSGVIEVSITWFTTVDKIEIVLYFIQRSSSGIASYTKSTVMLVIKGISLDRQCISRRCSTRQFLLLLAMHFLIENHAI